VIKKKRNLEVVRKIRDIELTNSDSDMENLSMNEYQKEEN
jgi:hypothetical protein